MLIRRGPKTSIEISATNNNIRCEPISGEEPEFKVGELKYFTGPFYIQGRKGLFLLECVDHPFCAAMSAMSAGVTVHPSGWWEVQWHEENVTPYTPSLRRLHRKIR